MSAAALLVAAAALVAPALAKRHYKTKSYRSPDAYGGAGVINVHLVPHSHDDVGWLKTVDQYATGGNNSIQHANTGLTIGSVLQNLRDNADRTFSYVEQAFFQRWVEVRPTLTRPLSHPPQPPLNAFPRSSETPDRRPTTASSPTCARPSRAARWSSSTGRGPCMT